MRTIGFVIWGLTAGGIVLCELLSLPRGSRVPGVGRVIDLLVASNVRFVVFFVGWMWLGWHFFAR
jgi:hypothetical protein